MSHDLVFQPIAIGGATLANRIVRTAHGTGLAVPHITDGFIDYHRARAIGGCALSIIEASRVHWSTGNDLQLYGDQIVPGYKRLMAAIKPYGMRMFQQLFHGGNVYPAADGGAPWSVSDIPGPQGLVGRTMAKKEIDELVDAFVASALRAEEGGLDGVEVHAAHSYLIHQFLSPFYNVREDEYGGDIHGRSRFLVEVLRSIRRAVSPGFAVGVRLGAGIGVNEEDCKQVIAILERDRLIDYVNVSIGDYFRMDTIVGGMHHPTGYQLASSADIASVASVPRLVTGRFRTLDEVAQVLRDGKADLVSMVRAMIADPDLVRKTREGRTDQVRPCIACNQGCVGGLLRNGRLGCTVNPAVGTDLDLAESLIKRTETPLRVMIAGGGPAGMEAARIAALQGHKVVLVEAQPRLGGAVSIARAAPKLHTLGDITYWLEQEVFRLGVEVRLGTYLEAAEVRAENPDVLIVATGSMPRMDGIQVAAPGHAPPGVNLPHVLSSRDLIEGTELSGASTALVLDSVGHYEGLAVIEFLLKKGIAVTHVTYTHTMMKPYVQSTWRDEPARERFYKEGKIEWLPQHWLVEIQPQHCLVQPSEGSEAQRRSIPADRVILVTHNRSLDELFTELRAALPVYLIGDARAPRDVQLAIREGHLAARDLSKHTMRAAGRHHPLMA
jgi:2,4-dienoyl-CoA reductase-like NADH-dependent reductase (Old Yellow Enzyme family)